jgi:hypothetical protein
VGAASRRQGLDFPTLLWQRHRGRRGWRRGGRALLQQQHDLFPDFRLDRTELVLRVDAVLLAESEEVLALQAQLTGKRKDAHLFFLLLQAELPWSFIQT